MMKKGSFTVGFTTLYKFIAAINALVPECRMHVSKDQVSVIVVDCANVGMIDAEITTFEKMKCPEEIALGLNIGQIYPALKQIKDIIGDSAETIPAKVSWSPGKDTPMLDIEVMGFRSRFTTLTDHSVRKDPDHPKITVDSKFECDGESFRNAIRYCAIFAGACRIEVVKGGDCIIAAKGDTDQCRVPLVVTGATGEAVSMYSLDYLKDFAKAMKDSGTITIEMTNDYPVRFSCEPAPGLSVRYLLAPRIDEEGETKEWMR
jgi:DNA polymerase III sliding clamp (beta) subunit (PCNA family)